MSGAAPPRWHARRGRSRRLDSLAVVAVFGVLMVVPAGVVRLANSDVRSDAALTGTVSEIKVGGPADTAAYPLWVWRPPGPDSASLPVVYLLHGYPGTPRDACSSGLARLLNQRLREGYEPFVVACPDGNGAHHSDTEWANSWDGSDQVMSRVVDSVIPAVEGDHPRPASLRVIAGFSMGGYGAMNIAMQNPRTFGAVVTIAGYFVTNDLSGMFGHRARTLLRNDPSAHPASARGMRVVLEEDAADPLPLIRGQAAWMGGMLTRAGVSAVVRISPGTHDWPYALGALNDALNYLYNYWQQAATRAS
jgi:S-formylglutathione hydrolase FrmB